MILAGLPLSLCKVRMPSHHLLMVKKETFL